MINDTRNLKRAETILVVEDIDGVREIASEMLRKEGYHILEARHGQEALDIYSKQPANIDLIFTDIVMPVMGGGELAQHVWRLVPQMKVLFASVYAQDAKFREDVEDQKIHFIAKPYNGRGLLKRIKEILAFEANSEKQDCQVVKI
jgi:two-component system, cell cycle sensor histidine kinase and response regulator CckA